MKSTSKRPAVKYNGDPFVYVVGYEQGTRYLESFVWFDGGQWREEVVDEDGRTISPEAR